MLALKPFSGLLTVTLCDTVILWRYNKQLHLYNSSFVPKGGENLSRRSIEARITKFQTSIDAIIGRQRHAEQPRSFSNDLKVTHMLLCIVLHTSCAHHI